MISYYQAGNGLSPLGVGVVSLETRPPHLVREKNLSKPVDFSEILRYYKHRTNVRETIITKGMLMLSQNDRELLRMIRENDNPDNALLIATQVILEFLKQPESFEEQAVACLPVLD